MATEMRALDIDLSFAPVLDLKRGNRAIGERAFHADPAVVSALDWHIFAGMPGGMAATIKHFPATVQCSRIPTSIAHGHAPLDVLRGQ
jgi:beta-N-acetylhexosaminidase